MLIRGEIIKYTYSNQQKNTILLMNFFYYYLKTLICFRILKFVFPLQLFEKVESNHFYHLHLYRMW